MYIIAINTVIGKPEVACLDIRSGSGLLLVAPEEQKQDQGFFVILQNLFQQREINAGNCEKIAVFNGPGRFTWTRSGLTVAKTLAFVWGKSIVAPCVHDVLAGQTERDLSVLAIMPAGGGSFYVQIGERPVQVIPGKELAALIKGQQIRKMIGWGWEYALGIEDIERSVSSQVFTPTALDLARFSLPLAPVDQTQILPLYAKPLHLDKVDQFKSKIC